MHYCCIVSAIKCNKKKTTDVRCKITSYVSEFSEEKASLCDLRLYPETEDLTKEPEARIGTGDGETWSQGEGELTTFNSAIKKNYCSKTIIIRVKYRN